MTNIQTSFGAWLRERRKALDLTQGGLAEMVGCAADTIRRFEAERQRPSREMADRLADKLAMEQHDRPVFLRLARTVTREDGRASSCIAPSVQPATLPLPPTPLVGRTHELHALAERLSQPNVRLLTLVGFGGTGKTRLAVELAARVTDSFTGVVFVPLADLDDPAGVIPTIAQTLGVREQLGDKLFEQLVDALQGRRMLLVLDNMEHLLHAAPQLADLLARCSDLKLLVTSRAALRLRGEHEHVVAPLALPDLSQPAAVGALERCPAVELFVQRVQAIRPNFTLNSTNAATIAAICVRLDGLPLALELAATRVKLLSPTVLLEHLSTQATGGSLALLTGGARDLPQRQQSLRDTIAWSYALLDAAEQRLFARLAVFAGEWTLEAAQTVCSGHIDNTDEIVRLPMPLLEELASLVDQSLLIQTEQSGVLCFAMLQTIREYALERLATSGELIAMQRRHALYYLV